MSASPSGGFCVKCGAPSSADGRFCVRCGSPSGGPSAPAGIHYAAPPKRSHHGAAIAVFVVLLLILIGVLAATVPVNQAASMSATIANPGSVTTSYTDIVLLAHIGVFTFAWATTNGGTTSVTVQDPAGSTIYSSGSASSGQGSFPVDLTGGYTFAIYDWSPETVQLSGTLHYTAPLI